MRREFCEKDGILITYTADDVCFEDVKTADSILLKNNGEIIHSNFDEEKNNYCGDDGNHHCRRGTRQNENG